MPLGDRPRVLASAIHLYLADQALVRHLQSLLVIWCRDWPMACSASQVSASGQMVFDVPHHIITIYEEVNNIFFLQSSIGWPAPDAKLKHYGSRPLQDPWKRQALGLWGLSSPSSQTMCVYCVPKARKAVGPNFTHPHVVVLYHNLGVHNLSLHPACHYQTLTRLS